MATISKKKRMSRTIGFKAAHVTDFADKSRNLRVESLKLSQSHVAEGKHDIATISTFTLRLICCHPSFRCLAYVESIACGSREAYSPFVTNLTVHHQVRCVSYTTCNSVAEQISVWLLSQPILLPAKGKYIHPDVPHSRYAQGSKLLCKCLQ